MKPLSHHHIETNNCLTCRYAVAYKALNNTEEPINFSICVFGEDYETDNGFLYSINNIKVSGVPINDIFFRSRWVHGDEICAEWKWK